MAAQFLTVGDVRLCVDVQGDAAAPPLVMLNGAYQNHLVWTPVMPALLEHFRVIRHDWRGSGRSTGGARPDYNFPQYADDLADVLDQLEVPRAHVCGMAYGARIAARFALNHAGRVDRLALYDVALGGHVDQDAQKTRNVEAREQLAAAGLQPVEVEAAWFEHVHHKEAMRSLTAQRNEPDRTDEMAACTLPTLVACGDLDLNLPEAERIAAVMPNAELRIMEMTAHASVFCRPDVFVQYLVEFLAPGG